MPRIRTMLLAMLATFAVAAPADASRRATKAETRAIKRVALKACQGPPGEPCRFRGARVSTRNARYAWATVVTEGFSGALLKRRTPRSRRFRVVGTQGGGIGDCREWRKLAPRSVLRDLRVHGVLDDSGTSGSCG
jgi:curli biogenesis system outer membrane secretion channel CsgG